MFLRKNSMITRNGDSRQAERTREYVSIGENRMSVRTNLIFIWWHKFLFGSKYISPISSTYIYAGFCRAIWCIGRSGTSDRLRRTNGTLKEEASEQVLGANWMRNPKWKGQFFKLTLDYYVVHPTSNGSPKCYHNRQLPNGTLAAHTNTYLSLLPPGPDEVRKIYVAQEPFVQHLLLWASLTGDALWSGIHSIYSGFMVTGCRYLPN